MRMMNNGAALPPGHAGTSLFFGVFLLLAGAAMALLSAWQFKRFLRELSHPEVPRGHATWPGPLMNLSVAVAAFGMAAWFVITG